MRLLYLFLITITSFAVSFGQDDFVYEDEIYLDYIRSVKFHHPGLFTSIPIIDLGTSGSLILSFDDLEAGDKDFTYEIIHCDKNWQPSDLDEYDFIEGFNDEEINEVNYSIGTFLNYTHYELVLPNDDITWTISGNYLLVVYEDEYDKTPAITRRFMVVEPLVTILAQVDQPMNVSKFRTHHEIDFSINFKDFRIINPMKEIQIALLQNNRWDNALIGIKPRFVRGENIDFNFVDQHNFPAGKEFRGVDLRSTRYRGNNVHSIDRNANGIDMLIYLDENRYWKNYHTYDDINGQYVIETADDRDSDLQSEYMNVFFSLDLSEPILEGDVYVMGAFTDWQCREENRMEYDSYRKMYTKSIELKQGYYDYVYAIKKGDDIDYSALEGNWFETENEYTVLAYYSEFGARYDRLIGLATLNTAR